MPEKSEKEENYGKFRNFQICKGARRLRPAQPKRCKKPPQAAKRSCPRCSAGRGRADVCSAGVCAGPFALGRAAQHYVRHFRRIAVSDRRGAAGPCMAMLSGRARRNVCAGCAVFAAVLRPARRTCRHGLHRHECAGGGGRQLQGRRTGRLARRCAGCGAGRQLNDLLRPGGGIDPDFDRAGTADLFFLSHQHGLSGTACAQRHGKRQGAYHRHA